MRKVLLLMIEIVSGEVLAIILKQGVKLALNFIIDNNCGLKVVLWTYVIQDMVENIYAL